MKCSVEVDAAVARGTDRLQLELELARGEGAVHPLLAEQEGVAEGTGTAEARVVGAEVDAALVAAQAGVDRDRGGRVGPVADGEGNAVVAGVCRDPGGRVFEDALFGFGFFAFFDGDFGAELDVFFVFDRALARVFARFGFFRFVAGFGDVALYVGCDEWDRGQRQAQRLRRDGDRAER